MTVPFLRDAPSPETCQRLAALEVELAAAEAAGDPTEQMRLTGLVGELQRVAGRDGRAMARRALELADQVGDDDAVIRNRIRLATSRFYQGEHIAAEEELRSVVGQLESARRGVLLDFAYQHLGKCIAEQGRFDEAITWFEKALDLRTDPHLRASSQRAIDAARRA